MKCTIINAAFAYQLIVDGKTINFQGADAADYFEEHYKALGYTVERTEE